MLNAIRGMMATGAAALVVALIASHFGRAHPGFDSLAAFRVQIALGMAGLIFFSIAFSALVTRAIAIFGLFLALADLGRGFLPGDPIGQADLMVWTHNLRFSNPTPDAVIDAVNLASPDIVLLQEVNQTNLGIVDRLAYKTEVLCPQPGVGGPAVLSRYPLVDKPGCAPGLAWARVKTPQGAVTAVSIHMHWPWPYRQAQDVPRIAEILAALPEPLLISGDFNNAAWAWSVESIATATGTRPVKGLRLTFERPEFWPGLPLDHVLVSEDLLAQTDMLGSYGSDHRALLTRINQR